MSESETETLEGRILRGVGGFYYVETGDGRIYSCRARGSFRRDDIRPLPGDRARFVITHEEDREGSLTEIMERKSVLIRPAVANADQALLFFAVKNPDPSLNLVDRYLLFLAQYDLPAVLVFNKRDIAEKEDLATLSATYGASGHPLCFLSVRTGEGMEELKKVLEGKTTVLAGPSGAGKSSLINRICPMADAETGELSRKLSRGKNTTRHSELFRVGDSSDSWIVDTPGFTALELPDIEPTEVPAAYHEFVPYLGSCRFASCLHAEEPDCAIREAVERGEIPPVRYENYRMILRELREKQARRYR